MKWYKDLYLGESLMSSWQKVIRSIKAGKFLPDVYVIAFASNPENMLDIIPSRELLQSAYPKDALRIIGVARGKKEAIALVQQIVEETYAKTGDVQIRQYLKDKWREQL